MISGTALAATRPASSWSRKNTSVQLVPLCSKERTIELGESREQKPSSQRAVGLLNGLKDVKLKLQLV